MVLGKFKKKGITLQVDYIVSVLEIKPWPPTVALCSVNSVLIQWENTEQNTGFLPPGIPCLNGFEDGKIEFNEFFKLPVTLIGKNAQSGFQKNSLDFQLYEPKKDKAIKGQLLGSASVNLAEYGIIRDAVMISVPILLKKVSKGTTVPMLYVQIQPFDNEGIESVLKMMSECNNDDESSEFASVDDDDDCGGGGSSFSRTPSGFQAASSPFQIDEMLNFVNGGLNSDATSTTTTQENSKYNRISVGSRENDDSSSERKSSERESVFSKFSDVATTRKKTIRSTSNLIFGNKGLDLHGFGDKLKHIKSVRLTSDTPVISAAFPSKLREESSVKEVVIDVTSQEKNDKKEKKGNNKPDDYNRGELEARIEMLEEELRESAALEIGIYAVSAEHLNSKRKVHASARRLSRFYRHVCRTGSQSKRASSARSIISGLVLVSKACANDIPRLTFWLSNAIILRAMVSQITDGIPASAELTRSETKARRKKSEKKCPVDDSMDNLGDWEDPQTFIMALEKVEAWIFFRIVEGLWWQSFITHMQPAKTKKKKGRRLMTRKTQKWKFGLGDQEQGNVSVELWKKAFQDACEKLCPIRAGGHDCGCLPMLSRMVMEQLADRLDVAMFNAILRDSDEDMPTDPTSDPITELMVLPIPAGKSSFGSGAQLKNAVGSWSKWLGDFFGADDDQDELNDDSAFKAFHLLNALGNLMMLPLEMLSDSIIRKEVCPILGVPLVKRVFANFVPDDFSPNPITEEALDLLDTKNTIEDSKNCIMDFPCVAKPVVYSPLPTGLFSTLLGDVNNHSHKKNGSSLLRKSHNSDDDLDKLNAPLTSINVKNLCISPSLSKPNWMPRGKGGQHVTRYQLLQEAWRN